MAFFSNKKGLTEKFGFIELLWQQLQSFYAPINCFHQGQEGRQTPGELKIYKFALSNSPPKGEKL